MPDHPRSADSPEGKASGAPTELYRYEAFISYRHVDPDRWWAKWLHSALETYRVPRRLVQERKIRSRLGRVFRDEDELSASANLSSEIEQALQQSMHLIVVCSPHTPASEWVNREVERFREMGRHDRILALLIEGEPHQSFPRALCEIRRSLTDLDGNATRQFIEQVEPLAADVRGAGIHGRRVAKLRLVSQLIGVRFDDLWQRERRRRQRNAAVVFGLLALSAGFGIPGGRTLLRATSVEQADRLLQQFKGRLRGSGNDPTALLRMQHDVAQLTTVNSAKGSEARALLVAQYRQTLHDAMRGMSSESDFERARHELADLRGFDANAADQLEAELQQARTSWTPVADIAAPFSGIATVFDSSQVRVEDGSLSRVTGGDSIWAATKIPAGGHVRAQLACRPLAPGSTVTFGVGMAGTSDWEMEDYRFVVSGRMLRITRRKAVIAERQLERDLEVGRELLLTALRRGDSLSVQVNDEPPLEIQEYFTGASAGRFTVGWDRGVKVTRLLLERQLLPESIDPFQAADELFIAQDFAAARSRYLGLEATAEREDERRGASFKLALCDLELHDRQSAARKFDSLFANGISQDRWGLRAGCQLWIMALQDKSLDRAAQILEQLRLAREDVFRLVPRDQFSTAVFQYTSLSSWDSLLFADQLTVRQLEQAARAAETIQDWFPLSCLLKAYSYMGRYTDMDEAVKPLLHQNALPSLAAVNGIETYSWALRTQGQPKKAWDFLNPFLRDVPADLPEFNRALLVERARIRAALGQFADAEADLSLYFHDFDPKLERELEAEVAAHTAKLEPSRGNPNDADAFVARGKTLTRLGRLEEAEKDFDRAMRLAPGNHWPWYYRGALLAYLQRQDKYTEHCRAMAARFGEIDFPEVLDRTTKTCALIPGVVDPKVLMAMTDRMRQKAGPVHALDSWFNLSRAIALWRAGDHRECLKMAVGAQLEPDSSLLRVATADLVIALASDALHEQAAATQAFDRAARARGTLSEPGTGDLGMGEIENWLIFQVLFREAATRLNRQSATTRPYQEVEANWRDRYYIASSGRLLQGVLRKRRGDLKGAQKAWEAALVLADGTGPGNVGQSGHGFPAMGSGVQLMNAAMIGGLTGKWIDAEGEAVLGRLIDSLLPDGNGGLRGETLKLMFAQMFRRIPPATTYRAWVKPDNWNVVEDWALRNSSSRQLWDELGSRCWEEATLALTGDESPDPARAAVYRAAATALVTGVTSKQLSTTDAKGLVLMFFLAADDRGWDRLVTGISAGPSKAAIAYVFSRRFRYVGQSEAADRLAALAVAAAGPGSAIPELVKADAQHPSTQAIDLSKQ